MSGRDEAPAHASAAKAEAFDAHDTAAIIRLGLIGDNIADSKSPRLHRLAASLCGLRVSYDLLIPPRMDADFETVFSRCAARGYRGVNVTFPYKERVVGKVDEKEARCRHLGGINTVVFESGRAKGYNTDYSGFIAAWRKVMGDTRPGTVCLVGAGGVGKAVAFALLALGLDALRIVERDHARAETLAAAMTTEKPGIRIDITVPDEAARGADGLVNCTPVGMFGYQGTALPRKLMSGASWAFDAVYTPVDTVFLRDAAAQGLRILSGYELFFYQGIDAFEYFTGHRPNEADLRAALASADEGGNPPSGVTAG